LRAVPIQLGLPTLVVRETAKLKQAGEFRQMYRLWSWASLAVLAASMAMVLPVWLLAPLLFSATLTLPLLLIVMLLVPFMSLGALRAGALRGLGHVIQGQLPDMLLRPGFILLLIAAVITISNSGLDARIALILNLSGTALAFLTGMAFLVRAAPASDRGAAPQTRHRDWIRAGLFLGIASSAMVVNNNLDMAMLGNLRPATEVGVYKIAITLSMLSASVLNMLNLAAQARIASLYAADQMDAMRRLITLVARVGFGAACLVALGFSVMGPWLIDMAFGAEFSAAYALMLIMVAGQLANTFFGPIILLLNMTGHEKIVMWSVILAAVGNIALNSILIPLYGATGAAFSTTTTLLAWNAILNAQSLRKLGIDSSFLGFHRSKNGL
jgi:O-antigen/teichoic acid export membrane protein